MILITISLSNALTQLPVGSSARIQRLLFRGVQLGERPTVQITENPSHEPMTVVVELVELEEVALWEPIHKEFKLAVDLISSKHKI
ncbi:hypothetical protein GJ744_005665 [Endocarpon pusillum]|uniref:Uncharacterized protein n=1 Tax=Endocarpon pusillum TaxID=364733 RepID=A0A8H7A4K6_9EURO|nr:hypothetical protein GJ744_005665 [Endocarpon pusillum]